MNALAIIIEINRNKNKKWDSPKWIQSLKCRVMLGHWGACA